MKTSLERLAMLDDIGVAGSGSVKRLADEYNVTARNVYRWLEQGFPLSWDQAAHELFRERFLRATGGPHYRAHLRRLASALSGDGLLKETTDVVGGAADLLRMVTEALDDGTITAGERLDIAKALRALEAEVAEASAALEEGV